MNPKEFDEFIAKLIRYIKRQNFNGTPFHLKKNLITYINDKAEEQILEKW